MTILAEHSFEKVLFSVIPLFSRKKLDKGIQNLEVTKEEEDDEKVFPTMINKYDFQIFKLLGKK
jgi:hypothetical protein